MRTKITVPAAGMSSADWDGVDPDIRERSFWTAREGCYARVQGFRDRCHPKSIFAGARSFLECINCIYSGYQRGLCQIPEGNGKEGS